MMQYVFGNSCGVGLEAGIELFEQSFYTPAKVGAAQSEEGGNNLCEHSDQQADACQDHHEGNDGIKTLEYHRLLPSSANAVRLMLAGSRREIQSARRGSPTDWSLLAAPSSKVQCNLDDMITAAALSVTSCC